MKTTQQVIDEFYHKNGPCCAGCDYWRWVNSVAGQCIKTAPVANSGAMLGIESCSLGECEGQIITPRDHFCSEFKDEKTPLDISE